MILLPPNLIKVDEKQLKNIDFKVKEIYRNVIFNTEISSKKLLESFQSSTNSLTDLLTIKNAQMEAQNEEELAVYIKNLNNTIAFVLNEIKAQTPFTKEIQLFQLFRLLSPESYQLHPNRYRDTLVMVGNYYCPDSKEIPGLVTQLFQNINEISNPLIKAIYFHHELIRIHPFVDGNGRVTRIAKNWILMYELYPPIFIKDNIEKKMYIKSLNDSFKSLQSRDPQWNNNTSTFFQQEMNRVLQNINFIINKMSSNE